MSAQIITGIDFRSKSRDKIASGDSFDFAAIEAEITAALFAPDIRLGAPVIVPAPPDDKEPA